MCMSLSNFLQSANSIDEIAEYLDGLSQDDRLAQSRTLNRTQQRNLYDLAKASPPLDLDFFVPTTNPCEEVIHYGRNTLPLPSAIKLFEKRFCRPKDKEDCLYGYNEGKTRPLIGPGYFVAKTSPPQWQERGAIVIDYFEVPSTAVVPSWPPVKPNSSGLQFFVYNKTRDFMRRVSKHISIGAAYKKENPLGHFFILCRND